MSASLLGPMDDGQGGAREPLSVVVIYQDDQARDRAKVFYQMMEQEFGDDFCFDCVSWSKEALAEHRPAVTQDACEADLVLLALGQDRSPVFVEEASNWLRSVSGLRHEPFSLVCLTDDPMLGTGRVHATFRELAGHFSMIYLAEALNEPVRGQPKPRPAPSAVTITPVLFQQLVGVDPHHTGGIND